MSFGLETPGVKGYYSGEEDAVNSLDLLVFSRSDGKIDSRARAGHSTTVTAEVTEGKMMDWFIVANAPENALSSFTTEQEFLESRNLLGFGMTMFASGSGTFSEYSHNVSAQLERYASKVSLERIAVDWPGSLPCRLQTVALINAVGSCPWSGTPEAGTLWYNCSAVDAAGHIRQMLVWEQGAVVDTEDAVDIGAELYTMPNPSTGTAYGLPWSPRCTRLVLELVTSDGITNWYSVDLPPMECNCHYLVRSAVIKGPGAPGPDMETVRSGITCEISILPWGTEETDVEFAS